MRFVTQEVADGRDKPALKPEERLLLAVVESAFWDLQSQDAARRRTAQHYFFAEDTANTFSFLAICQHFNWSPVSIRTRLTRVVPGGEPVSTALAC